MRTNTKIRDYLRNNRSILITGIVILILGLALDVLWLLKTDWGISRLHLINLLPGTLVIAVWFLASAFPQRRQLLIRLGVVIAFLGVGYAIIMNLGAALWDVATAEVTDVARYEDTLEYLDYPDSKLVAHFPAHILENATETRFYYLPKFLQGAMYLQLRCKLPISEVDSIFQQYFEVARQIQNSNGDVVQVRDDDDRLPTPLFRNEENDSFAPLPESYSVIILDAEPVQTDPDNWNHGYSYGVAVSVERHEVIYWSEYW
jgi:hypothetical protein